ncbi:ABC transporter ATP-binding protein [Phyllobacterium myrsinacearum]|uniref:Lipopolysaccharide transport system ATP-binding protein n=1 Tax=Phyllobacterium myrsinacearum TaxID=28101 RepID=A0A839EVE7_9HYPH|nr:ABC transporter ATP-binding protein [Phyllobacterium myrsinacearum]MBA8882128.1 lipopolysaccharide transport system ATP-binding protein [Phyllobacterium myrsinacearum]
MSSETVIRVTGVSKAFQTFARPHDRLVQALYGLASRLSPVEALAAKLRQKASARSSQFWALRDVSLEVKRGETVGIIGRNGSGKSTLLQIICGTLQPTSGDVFVTGRVAALLELGSGFNPEFTGRENVYLNGQLYGLSKAQLDDRFDSITSFADIGDFIEQPVKTYSSGMLVRLAFAVIAHVDADVLVVDEALAVGDAFFTQKCMRFLREFMKTGTILFVSHDTASVKNLCSEALWIERGTVLETGVPRTVCDRYLEAFYEEQQGKSTTTRLRPVKLDRQNKAEKDQRLQFINHTELRNDLKVFEFDALSSSFGNGEAQIVDVHFGDRDGNILSWVVGGEEVVIHVQAIAHRDLDAPIVGFYIKDRLGQTLFGDNTYLTRHDDPLPVVLGQMINASFVFQMPILPKGDYSVCVAVANGTQDEHTQLHWIHDALFFKSDATSVTTGLIGIPMLSIDLAKADTANA